MSKIEHALIRLAERQAEVKRISQDIGAALAACPLGNSPEYEAWARKQPQGALHYTHLGHAYQETVEDDDGYRSHQRKLNIDEVDDVLRGMSDWDIETIGAGLPYACPHCLAAHRLVQARKAARIQLGHAKRALTVMGKTPLKAKETATD